MNQKQDNKVSNNIIQGDLKYNPKITYKNTYNYNPPEDSLSNKSVAEKAVHYNNLGNAQIDIDSAVAIEYFGKSINYDSSIPAPHIGLGIIAYRQKNLNVALAHFRRAELLYEKFPTLADQRQEVAKLIQHILEKQKKPWFMRLF